MGEAAQGGEFARREDAFVDAPVHVAEQTVEAVGEFDDAARAAPPVGDEAILASGVD